MRQEQWLATIDEAVGFVIATLAIEVETRPCALRRRY